MTYENLRAHEDSFDDGASSQGKRTSAYEVIDLREGSDSGMESGSGITAGPHVSFSLSLFLDGG